VFFTTRKNPHLSPLPATSDCKREGKGFEKSLGIHSGWKVIHTSCKDALRKRSQSFWKAQSEQQQPWFVAVAVVVVQWKLKNTNIQSSIQRGCCSSIQKSRSSVSLSLTHTLLQ